MLFSQINAICRIYLIGKRPTPILKDRSRRISPKCDVDRRDRWWRNYLIAGHFGAETGIQTSYSLR